MPEQSVLPKVLRLRVERIAKVHFDAVYPTNNPNIVQGKLPNGQYVVVDLAKKIVVEPPKGYEEEIRKKQEAGLISAESTELAPETQDRRETVNLSAEQAITQPSILSSGTKKKLARKKAVQSTVKKSSKK